MLPQLLARFTPFHIARTPEEREAIQRFGKYHDVRVSSVLRSEYLQDTRIDK